MADTEKKAMVIFAHPVPESFSSALHTRVVETLKSQQWQVDDCDLNAENFPAVMTCEERRSYHDETININPVKSYVERLQAADAIVFVYPVWNFGYPAILKGFFDRVFLPGVSFKLVDGQVRPALTNVKKYATVTTYGGTRLRAFMAGDPPRKLMTRPIRYVMNGAPMQYLALYDMNRASDQKRAAFLAHVTRHMERF
ncbi:NAD(P)H-dependent oxidoreductase [Ahrensia marina]|uniref:NAD(P)H-dependent oxidoreductase n=1 Tax=Ahrensia marina TaxID=1514904 RepID=UPI0035D11B15